jgi:hypothetical protein
LTVVGDSRDGVKLEDRVGGPLKNVSLLPIRFEAPKDLLQSGVARFLVDDSVKNNCNMTSDAQKDLLDSSAQLSIDERFVGSLDEGGNGDRGRSRLRETSGHCVGSDAFDKA